MTASSPGGGRSSRRHRLTLIALAVAVLVAAGLVVWEVSRRGVAPPEGGNAPPEKVDDLRSALAETDRLDPGWRLEDLEAKRRVFAPEENSAVCIRAVEALRPKDWTLADLPQGESPNRLLGPEGVAVLRRELDRVGPALEVARRLRDLPDGRHPVVWAPDYISTPTDHLTETRSCVHMLEWQARRHIQEDDPAAALACCRAMLNAGRSFGDEPYAISQLTRLAIQVRVILTLERALAQGQPDEPDLRRLQQALEREAEHPMFLVMRRCERIWSHVYLTGLTDGSLKWSAYQYDPEHFPQRVKPDPVKDATMARLAAVVHGRVLLRETKLVEIAKLPAHRWKAEVDALPRIEIPEGADELFPHPEQTLTGCARGQALLRSAAVALAVERYRAAHRKWPDSLEALTPTLLTAVPLDPFDGRPLRYRRLEDGVVIYSVGPDLKDEGGAVLWPSNQDGPRGNVGVRLWDTSRRRLPPAPGMP